MDLFHLSPHSVAHTQRAPDAEHRPGGAGGRGGRRSAAEELLALRAEAVLQDTTVDVVVARAAGSARSLLRLLRPAGDSWRRLVLSKGPRAADELEEARRDADRMGLRVQLHEAGELPDGRGARWFLVYSREDRETPSSPAR